MLSSDDGVWNNDFTEFIVTVKMFCYDFYGLCDVMGNGRDRKNVIPDGVNIVHSCKQNILSRQDPVIAQALDPAQRKIIAVIKDRLHARILIQ